MSRIPAGATQEVQDAFREIWGALRPWLTQNVDLHGRRFMNAGKAIDPADFLTKYEFDDVGNFESIYRELKARGLDGFTGTLAEPQQAKIETTLSTTPPRVTDVDKLIYETDTGLLKYGTGSALSTINGTLNAGLYSARPAATSLANGYPFYATDQNTLYVVESGAWVWVCGVMVGTLAPDQRPTLVAGDVGFLFRTSDTSEMYRWSGTAWTQLLLAIDSPTLVVDPSGHLVGIGTASPSAKLSINGGCHVGGTSDPGDNNLLIDGILDVTGLTKTTGGVHVGGTSDPGADNLLVDGTGVVTGGFGCNSKTAQTAYASGGAIGVASGTPTLPGYGFTSLVEMSNFISSVNAIGTLAANIRLALIANGIMS